MVDPGVTQVAAELARAGFVGGVEIGRGGSGKVYRCVQTELGRAVAVKVLAALSDEDRADFARQQQAMARLTGHPHIVAVLQVGQTDSGYPYLVMPLCGQGSLQDHIAQRGALALDETLVTGAKMADALAAAHQVGVVHRDVTPTNIMFTDYGEPALIDFAVPRVGAGVQPVGGVCGGTPAFTAPEVLDGSPPCEASDVYGLGATLFAALTGHAVFERRHGDQTVAQFVQITGERLPDPSEHHIPAEVATILAAAMAPDPTGRPSAAELGEQLRRVRLRHPGQGDTSTTTSRPPVGHLPVLTAEVLGRGAEVVELRNLMAGSRLVTLTGVGGVGKTTLALHAAAELRTEYPDGVWLVDLGPLHDGTLVTETVAAALGGRDQPGRLLSEVLMERLGEGRTLLVLDNCEHLIEDAAKFVDTALHHCPNLRVLATSRVVLGVVAEHVLAVSPLSVPDAAAVAPLDSLAAYPGVALFLQRATAAVPEFTLTSQNAAAVTRICARLEGLPLAIELAAARTRVMSAEQIADGLDDRYMLLTRGHRGAPTRHRTLSACIDWSYQLCTRPEQQLWAALAVFAGSFDLSAARHLCGDDLSTEDLLLDLLGALVDKSILIRTQQREFVRFRLLETLREHARTHLTEGEQHRLRARHAAWYHQLLAQARDQWFGHGQLYWSERLLREMPNIREGLQFALKYDPAAAIEMVVAMRPMWQKTGMFGEARRWLELALGATAGQASVPRVLALGDLAVIAFIQHDFAAACAAVSEAREHLTVIEHDAELSAKFDLIEGYIAMQTGEIEQAAECFRSALEVAAEFELRFTAMHYLGWAFEILGDLDQAMSCFEGALEFSRSRGESMCQARALVSVGMGHWLRGEGQRAQPAVIESLRLSHSDDNPANGALCLEVLAWVAGSRHDWRHAVAMMAAADAVGRTLGTPLLDIPDQVACHDVCYRESRQALGAEAFDAAWADGAQLDFDGAVAMALDSYENGPGGIAAAPR